MIINELNRGLDLYAKADSVNEMLIVADKLAGIIENVKNEIEKNN